MQRKQTLAAVGCHERRVVALLDDRMGNRALGRSFGAARLVRAPRLDGLMSLPSRDGVGRDLMIGPVAQGRIDGRAINALLDEILERQIPLASGEAEDPVVRDAGATQLLAAITPALIGIDEVGDASRDEIKLITDLFSDVSEVRSDLKVEHISSCDLAEERR
jgi:hypothetical protein